MKTKKVYYRILKTTSKELSPFMQVELYPFDSLSYETDLKYAKENYLRGRKFLFLSRKTYNNLGERIKIITETKKS